MGLQFGSWGLGSAHLFTDTAGHASMWKVGPLIIFGHGQNF